MLLPYRAKNPPERFPYVTLSLIAINCAVYLATCDTLITARDSVVKDFALSHATLGPVRLVTSLFLHEDILHLFGNMLALWIFGAAVEGRLRPAKFLLLYFTAGIAGSLLHDAVNGVVNPGQYSLGASGAIMGVAAAYLYMFPFSTICVFYSVMLLVRRVALWQARWVVTMYIGMDILFAFLFRGGDGVAHFAHLGGFGAGLVAVVLMRPRQDNEDVSNVKATRSEVGDNSLLGIRDLETLLEYGGENIEYVYTYCVRAWNEKEPRCQERAADLFATYGARIVAECEPVRLGWALLEAPVATTARIPTIYLLRLASRLEGECVFNAAAQIYQRIYEIAPTGPDSEAALYRMARLMEQHLGIPEYARETYTEMLRTFPDGAFSLEAWRAVQRLQRSGLEGAAQSAPTCPQS